MLQAVGTDPAPLGPCFRASMFVLPLSVSMWVHDASNFSSTPRPCSDTGTDSRASVNAPIPVCSCVGGRGWAVVVGGGHQRPSATPFMGAAAACQQTALSCVPEHLVPGLSTEARQGFAYTL